MILIVTHSQDLTADLVIRHLIADGRPFRRLDTDQLGRPECHFGVGEEPFLRLGNERLAVSRVGAVWHRRYALATALDGVAADYREFVHRELAMTMDAFFEAIDPRRSINPAEADRRSGNRLIQARSARRPESTRVDCSLQPSGTA